MDGADVAGGGGGGEGGGGGGAWSALKGALFGAADAASSSAGIAAPGENESVLRRPVDGYDAMVEGPALGDGGIAPGGRLTSRYDGGDGGDGYATTLRIDDPGADRGDDLPEDEELYYEDARPPGTGGTFGSVKDGLYGAFDAVHSAISGGAASDDDDLLVGTGGRVGRPIDRIDPLSFRPVARPSRNAAAEDEGEALLLPDLTSPNPLKRVRAELSLRSSEARRRRREEERGRADAADRVKGLMYGLGDGIGGAIDAAERAAVAASAVPAKAEEAAMGAAKVLDEGVEVVSSLPERVERAREAVASVPEKVTGAVEETARAAEIVAEDIKNIPDAVRSRVDETKRDIDAKRRAVVETAAKIEETTAKIQETAYDAAAAVGLAKRRPKPPPPPPPPPTKREVALGVASSAAKFAARAAWWAGTATLRGAAALTGLGARAALDAAAKSGEERSAKEREEMLRGIREENAAAEAAAAASLADVDVDLEREVADALRLAEEALGALEEKPTTTKAGKREEEEEEVVTVLAEPTPAELTVAGGAPFFVRVEDPVGADERREVDDAINRAREAAARALREARDLEERLTTGRWE